MRHIEILGVQIASCTREQALAVMLDWAQAVGGSRCAQVVTANTEMVMQARASTELQRVLAEADLVVPDSVGLLWAAERGPARTPFAEHLPGIELAEALLEQAAERGLRVFFLGGQPGVAEAAARAMQGRFAGLRIAGSAHGYFNDNDAAVLTQIKAVDPHIVLVGLGVPRQELWLARNRPQLAAGVAIGVGGAFDVWAGQVPRAPLWLRRLRCEWLYRLARQPWRARRMLALPAFVVAVWRARRSAGG